MKETIAVILVLIMAFVVGAVAQNALGKDLFVSKCAICHGADGAAKTPIGKNLKIRDSIPPMSKSIQTQI